MVLVSATELFSRRLIFVTGKGGVGKSTVASALGIVAARRGLRTIVAELSNQEQVQRAFGYEGEQFREVQLGPGLFTISIDPQHAMEEYLRVKARPIAPVLSSSRLFSAFAMATPGMRELLSIGKVWELAQLQRRTRGAAAYDLVIVDAPATGHGLGILRTPRTFADIARVGPIAHQGRTIARTIADRSFTAVAAVVTPEEMPVNETIALHDGLRREGLDLDLLIVNELYQQRFDEPEVGALSARLAHARSPLARSALRAALSEHARALSQRAQQNRLTNELRMDALELPYVFADQLGPAEIERLADSLTTELDVLEQRANGVPRSRVEGARARSAAR